MRYLFVKYDLTPDCALTVFPRRYRLHKNLRCYSNWPFAVAI